MKKGILLLGLLFLGSGITFGADCNYKCVQPYNMSGKLSTFFSTITGMNFTRTKISEVVFINKDDIVLLTSKLRKKEIKK